MAETASGYPIKTILVEDITAHPENPFRHSDAQLDAIRASYAALGDLTPLIYNERTGRLIDGHARFEVLKASGRRAVQCVVVNEDEAWERKALLTINRTAGMAGLDDEAFLSLLDQFDVPNDPLLSLMYDQDSVEALLNATKVHVEFEAEVKDKKSRAKDDRDGGGDAYVEGLAELPPTRTQSGEVWHLGRHRLLVGDCALTSSMRKLNLPPIDLVLTDPPYNIEATSGDTEFSSRSIWKDLRQSELDGFDPIPFLETVEIYLNEQCNFEVFCDQSLLPLYLDWGRHRRFTTDVVVWQKPNPTPLGGQRWPEVEYLVQMRRQGAFNHDAPHRRKKVLAYGRENGSHPTIKPLGLVLGELELLSGVEAVVFDPFVGTGTTIIAAERLGRTCYACEKSPRWADIAIARWEAETGRAAVLQGSKPVCITCGTTEDLEFAADPMASEINGDETPVWECHDCRHESAQDI